MGDICKSGVNDSGRDSFNGGWTVEVQKSKYITCRSPSLPRVYISSVRKVKRNLVYKINYDFKNSDHKKGLKLHLPSTTVPTSKKKQKSPCIQNN